ncbi:MAG: RagB/SusD family nutrient uptake outer membrane protein [Bacteroidales bacterium]|nr:RagB/SusD family nutrient uptake outer membrane protein [Bacteroidales bacterium]
MKAINYILAGFAALSLMGCDNFLKEEAKGQLSTDQFYNNKDDLAASLNALYSQVTESMRQNNFVGLNFLTGDDISTHPASNKQSLREFDQYQVADNNAWMLTMWDWRYRVIKVANFIINNAERTPEVSKEEITEAIAQAHYWRAFNYFYLVTTWGSVPVMTEEEIDYNAQRVPVEKIYELILSDLEIAEKGCPINYSSAPYFSNGVNVAVSKGAVKATMAYVYMCMAGWPLNKGAEYYAKAAQKAEEVIDGADNGTYYYKLLPNFKDVYSVAYSKNNPETILGFYYNRDQNPNYVPCTDFFLDMKQSGWGDTNGELKFWKDFPEGPRKDATYFPKIMLSDGELHNWWEGAGTREVVAPAFMKSQESSTRGEEFDYTNPQSTSGDGEKTIQAIRLAEVYCWYAEAVGRSGQVTTKAVEVLNRVRNRADGKATNLYATSMTPEQLAEAAYNEHGWEIAGYYWCGFAPRARDMFRMYRYKDHFEYRLKNPEIEVAPGVFLKEAVPVSGTWDDSRMYAPIPYDDVSYNPSLK